MPKHRKSSCRKSRWDRFVNLFGFRSKQCNCNGRKKRSYAIEPLEERQLLTVLTWAPNGNIGGDGDWMAENAWLDEATQIQHTWDSSHGDTALFKGGTVNVNTADIKAAKLALSSGSIVINGSYPLTLTGSTSVTADASATINSNLVLATNNQKWSIASGKTLDVTNSVTFTGERLEVQGNGVAMFHGALSGSELRVDTGGTTTFVDASSLTADLVRAGASTNGTINWNSSGTLTAGYNLYVGFNGGVGVFNQTDGVVTTVIHSTFNADVDFYYSGTYNLSGGRLETTAFNGSLGNVPTGCSLNIAGDGTLKALANFSVGLGLTVHTSDTPAHLDTNGFNVTLAGDISGAGTLFKDGDGTLTLSGNTAHTGTVRVTDGTLTLGSSQALRYSTLNMDASDEGELGFGTTTATLGGIEGSREISIPAGVALTVGNNTTTYAGSLTGSGQLVKAGPGTLTLTGASSHSGGTTVQAGVLLLSGDDDRLPASGDITVTGGELRLDDDYTQDISGTLHVLGGSVMGGTISGSTNAFDVQAGSISTALTGAVGLAKTGSGTATLSGLNSYTLGTTINGGNLAFGLDAVPYGTNNITINAGGALNVGGAHTTVESWLASGNINTSSDGTLALTGNVNVPIDMSGYGAYTSLFLGLTAGATFAGSSMTPVGSTYRLDGVGSQFNLPTGVLTGSKNLIVRGDVTLNGTNDFSGSTTVQSGTLKLMSPAAVPQSNWDAITVSDGTLEVNASSGSGWTSSTVCGLANAATFAAQTEFGIDTPNATDSFECSGVIDGDLNLTKAGLGTLTLTGYNTYTGHTTISAGTLRLADNGTSMGTLGGNDVSVANNATLAFADSRSGVSDVFEKTISGDGSISQQASNNTLIIRADSPSYSGLATVSGTGTLQLGDAVGTGSLGTGTIVSVPNSSVDVVFHLIAGAAAVTSPIRGNIPVTIDADTTLTLGGASILPDGTSGTGSVTVAGTLDLHGQYQTIGTLYGSGTITTSVLGSICLYIGAGNFSGIIKNDSGSLAVVKQGSSNPLILTGANTYSGGTGIYAGTLQVGDATGTGGKLGGGCIDLESPATLAFCGAAGSTTTISDAIYGNGTLVKEGSSDSTIIITNPGTFSGTLEVDAGTAEIRSSSFKAAVSGAPNGNGTVVFNVPGGMALRSNITGSVSVSIASGTTVTLGSGGNLPNGATGTGSVTVNGTLNLSTDSPIIGTLYGSGTITTTASGARSLTVFGGDFAGVISNGTGTVNLTKQGSGTLTLSRANTYTGTTTVSSGSLQYGIDDAIDSGDVVIAGGTLDLRAYSDSVGAVTLVNGGLLSSGTLTSTSGFTVQAGTISAVLVGSNLAKTGSGTVVVSNADLRIDHVTVNDGSLSFGDGTNFATLAGDITDNASLIINADSDVTFGNAINGNGSLVKQGVGTLRLTGELSSSLSEQAEAGAIVIGSSAIAPYVSVSGDLSVDEGTVYVLHLSSSLSIPSWNVAWGDGGNDSGTYSHTYTSPQDYQIVATATYDGEDVTVIRPVTVNDVAPYLTLSGASSVNEGDTYTLTLGDAQDVGENTVDYYIVHWGDSADPEQYSADYVAAHGRQLTHSYSSAGGGAALITVDLHDAQGTHLDAGFTTVNVPSRTPTVQTAASVTLNTTGTTGELKATGADDEGEANLTYTWVATTYPAGAPPTIGTQSGTNAGSDTPVTFHAAGSYVFTVTIADSANRTVTSTVGISVDQIASKVVVSPVSEFPALTPPSDPAITFIQPADGTDSIYLKDESGTVGTIVATGLPKFGNNYDITGSITFDSLSELGLVARWDASNETGYVFSIDPVTSSMKLTKWTSGVAQPMSSTTLASAIHKGDTVRIEFDVENEFYWSHSNRLHLKGTLYDSGGQGLGQFDSYDCADWYASGEIGTWAAKNAADIEGTWSNFQTGLGSCSTQQFAAVAYDQFVDAQHPNGHEVTQQPDFEWTVIGINRGTVTDGVYTAPDLTSDTSAKIDAWVTAASVLNSGVGNCVTFPIINQPPTVATAAAAADSVVTGTSTTLSVLGADDEGEAGLKYSWLVSPSSGVTLGYGSASNNSNAAKNATATFTAAGTYTFTVTITDFFGLSTTSALTVEVDQTITTIDVTSGSATPMIVGGAHREFVATAKDQFGNSMSASFDWNATAGSINSSGDYTPGVSWGPVTITAASGGVAGTALVTITDPEPTTSLRRGDTWTYGLWQQAQGNAVNMSRITGQAPITLSSAAGSFTFSPVTTSAPPKFSLSNPAASDDHLDGRTNTTVFTWESADHVTFTSSETDYYEIDVDLELTGTGWTYHEILATNYTVVTYLGVDTSGTVWSNASGSYGYDFNASGSGSDSVYTCTVTADACAGGNYTDPTQVGGSTLNPWAQTSSGSDTIVRNDYTATASRSGSGSTPSSYTSYSYSVPYAYSANGGTISGTEKYSGSEGAAFNYSIAYQPTNGNWLVTGGSASNHVTKFRNYSYSGSGNYSTFDAGWAATGTQSESGGTGYSGDFTTYYSLSGGAWQQSSGSGSESTNNGSHYSYSGGGTYWDSSLASASATDGGTFTQSGFTDEGASGTTSYSLTSGAWQATSGTGTVSGSGESHYSYTGGTDEGPGGAGDDGSNFSYGEYGRTDDSYSYTINRSLSGGVWRETGGTGTSSSSGYDDYFYSDNGTSSGNASGETHSWTINGGDGGLFSYTSYWARANGTWRQSGGDGWSHGDGYTDETYSANKVPYSYLPGVGETMSGTYNDSGEDHTSYEYDTEASYTSGAWADTGDQTASANGGNHYSYSGTGSYLQFGADSTGAYTATGTLKESGSEDSSYNETVYYKLNSDDDWEEDGFGSASSLDDGQSHFSYSGGGVYVSFQPRLTAGTFTESGSDDEVYHFKTSESSDEYGIWSPDDDTSGWTHDSGNSKASYDGGGLYRRTVAGSDNHGYIAGTTHESGTGSDSYDYKTYYTMGDDDKWATASGGHDASGNWQPSSGTATGNWKDYTSYSGNGTYWRTNVTGPTWTAGNIYMVHGTLQESGGVTSSGNYTTTSHYQTGWSTSGTGNTTTDNSYGYSYDGSGKVTLVYDNEDPAGTFTSSLYRSNASEQGSGSYTEHHTKALTRTTSSASWSATSTGDSTSGSSRDSYQYSGNNRKHDWNSDRFVVWTTQRSNHQDLYRSFGSSTDSTGTTSWSGASGNGEAWSDSLNYTSDCSYPSHTFDSWSKLSSSGPNTVYGDAAGFACRYFDNLLGYSEYQPFSVQYGETSPLTIDDAGFYDPDWVWPHYGTMGLGTPPLSTGSWQSVGMASFAPTGSQASPQTLSTISGIGIAVGLSGSVVGNLLGYDALGRVTTITDANSGITHFTHDSAGNLASLTDPVGNTTSWSYEWGGASHGYRVTSETDALGASRHFAYDSAGNLARYTDRNGAVRQFEYDALGNPSSEIWYPTAEDAEDAENPENTIVFVRDSAGRITSETDDFSSVTYVYNTAGQITSTTQSSEDGPTVTFDYQYDAAGRRTQMAATIGNTADFVDDYTYDSLGRVVSVHRHSASPLPPGEGQGEGCNAVADIELDFDYNADGTLASIDRYENGQLVIEGDYSYDEYGRLVGLVYHQGENVLNSYAWTYDGSGQWSVASGQSPAADWLPTGGLMPIHDTTGVTAALMSGGLGGISLLTTCTSNDGTANYSYDPTGQLIGAAYSGAGCQPAESYAYDANGNRLTANDNTYVTGADNRLLSDGTYRYAYDAEGNRVGRFIDVNADGVLDVGDADIAEYTWDARERLVEVTNRATFGGDPTQVVDYLYDVENRWIGENIDTNGDGQIDHEIRFAYDGNQIVLEFENDGSGAVTGANLSHRYLWQPDAVDQLMADEQAGNVVLPLADNLGTVRDLAQYDSQTGLTSVVNHRVYDSYGNLKSQTNAAVDCLFGFTGRALDANTGLNISQSRPYEAAIGQWLSEDWMGFYGGDTNTRRYVGNSPTNLTDPTGLWGPEIHQTVTGVLAAKAGMKDEYALILQKYANEPDLDPKRNPMTSWTALVKAIAEYLLHHNDTELQRAKDDMAKAASWHFPVSADGKVHKGSTEAWSRVNDAIEAAKKRTIRNRKIVADFGEGLHTLQDSYSHYGKPALEILGEGHEHGEVDIPILGTGKKIRVPLHRTAWLSSSADDYKIYWKEAREAGWETWRAIKKLWAERPDLFKTPIPTGDALKALDEDVRKYLEWAFPDPDAKK